MSFGPAFGAMSWFMVAILIAMILIVTIGLAVIAYVSRPEQKPVRRVAREPEWWERQDGY